MSTIKLNDSLVSSILKSIYNPFDEETSRIKNLLRYIIHKIL